MHSLSQGIRKGLRKWGRHITAAIAVAAVAGTGLVGYWSGPTFVADFAANFVADAVAALLLFVFGTVAFGFWQRRRREKETQRKARHLLKEEIKNNEQELRRITEALQASCEATKSAAMQRPLKLRGDTWQLFADGPLVNHLSVDLVWALQESYSLCLTLAARVDWEPMARASRFWSRAEWDQRREKALPACAQAWARTREAIDQLELLGTEER